MSTTDTIIISETRNGSASAHNAFACADEADFIRRVQATVDLARGEDSIETLDQALAYLDERHAQRTEVITLDDYRSDVQDDAVIKEARRIGWTTPEEDAYNAAATEFGTVEHDGRILALTQQAYCDAYGTEGEVSYYARAINDAGDIYKVRWDTTADWDARCAAVQAEMQAGEDITDHLDDESDACDWDSPAEIWAA